jgi:hypothetical protein
MSIQISSNNTHLRIVTNGFIRNINKQNIREISILRNTTLKIDIGGGALRNIFILIGDITIPTHTNATTLLTQLDEMLVNTDRTLIEKIGDMETALATLNESIVSIRTSSPILQPSLVDESNSNIIYTGYAMSGALPSEASWAIMRTTITDEVQQNTWANGTQTMESVWTNRANLSYS